MEIQLTTFCNHSMLLWDNRCSLVTSFSSAAFINVSLYNNIMLLSIFYLLFYIVLFCNVLLDKIVLWNIIQKKTKRYCVSCTWLRLSAKYEDIPVHHSGRVASFASKDKFPYRNHLFFYDPAPYTLVRKLHHREPRRSQVFVCLYGRTLWLLSWLYHGRKTVEIEWRKLAEYSDFCILALYCLS